MSRTHKSRYKGASMHGKRDITPQQHGRYLRHEGGAVPQNKRSLQEQLDYLDNMGLVAKKERAKIIKKMADKTLHEVYDDVEKQIKKDKKKDKKGKKNDK